MASLVVPLHQRGHPPHIAGPVIAVVVDAVEHLARLRITCRGVKFFKIPALDADAASAVIAVVSVVRVVAALLCVLPSVILARDFAGPGMAVFCTALAELLPRKAAATQREAVAQIGPQHEPFDATATATHPKGLD